MYNKSYPTHQSLFLRIETRRISMGEFRKGVEILENAFSQLKKRLVEHLHCEGDKKKKKVQKEEMMEDGMIDLPNLAFDEKIGNKRVRDDHGEVETNIGRLEKRPSGIFGVNGGGDGGGDGVNREEEGGGDGGGIIETFISNVFHKNESGIEAEEGGVKDQVNTDVFDFEVEDKSEDLGTNGSTGDGGDGGDGGGGGGGGGIINTLISNMFNHNVSGDGDGDQGKSDLSNEVVEKTEELRGTGGDGGGGWTVDNFISNVIHPNGNGRAEEPQNGDDETETLDAEKLTKKNDSTSEPPNKERNNQLN
ncbi:hypothetical protein OSB04_024944 [Centaurea solstitialis]|uniref:Uncharacterized protein n=1 Tax=Centaurea solstitialis TaxID=347529 RepID=A0AA38W3K2_9ASTR|nr:hypothetical protein OSB04_024944 [Centaurea solstitialis]